MADQPPNLNPPLLPDQTTPIPITTLNQEQDREPDLFTDALNLEDAFYAQGHASGTADGEAAGRIEGQLFGWEKGLEKGLAMGRLAGRGAVWRARAEVRPSRGGSAGVDDGINRVDPEREGGGDISLRPLDLSDRAAKALKRLEHATEYALLPKRNTEEGVDEFDERLREAEAKFALLARAVGEREGAVVGEQVAGAESSQTPARGVRIKPSARTNRAAPGGGGGGGREMEDFAGLPGTKR